MRETLFHICSPRVYGILLWDPVFGLLTESCVINDDGVCTGFREHEEVIESAEVVIKGDKGEVLKKVKPPNTVRKVTLFKEVCRNYKNNEVRDAILDRACGRCTTTTCASLAHSITRPKSSGTASSIES